MAMPSTGRLLATFWTSHTTRTPPTASEWVVSAAAGRQARAGRQGQAGRGRQELAGWRRLTAVVRRMRCRKKNQPSIRITFPEEMTIWLTVWFDFFWPRIAKEVGASLQ